jgi:hypothetical protein
MSVKPERRRREDFMKLEPTVDEKADLEPRQISPAGYCLKRDAGFQR